MCVGLFTLSQKQRDDLRSGNTPPHQLQRRPKVISSVGKVMALLFWDTKGFVFINPLQKGHVINGKYCDNVLRQLQKVNRIKHPGKLMKEVLVHLDNVPAHKSPLSMAVVFDCVLELVDYPPSSPDLDTCDFHLPRNMKKALNWKPVLQWKWRLIRCWWLFWPTKWKLLHQWYPNTVTLMKEVCNQQGDLCWKVKPNLVTFHEILS